MNYEIVGKLIFKEAEVCVMEPLLLQLIAIAPTARVSSKFLAFMF